ncbi:hypothetical protein F53441_13659 [Fusarium austroafricanum]|uniref:Uncharacterized protein n=1 Tax=Fusarium austroafricanum TaxID=2364996 RepID=A0A8H4NQ29_9HYPO|nr:hypothetical protein F53441_13659 [Fusarium austroafricanum]
MTYSADTTRAKTYDELSSSTIIPATTTESVPSSTSTEAPTTMMTLTRQVSEDPSTTGAATSASTGNNTEKPATTTQKAQQADPTDCAGPWASLSDDLSCGIPGQSGQQTQSARLQNYVITAVGSLAKCVSICL